MRQTMTLQSLKSIWLRHFNVPGQHVPIVKRCLTDQNISSVAPAGAHFLANDFDSALELVNTKLAEKADQIWILGGSSIYKVRNTLHLGLFHNQSVTFPLPYFYSPQRTPNSGINSLNGIWRPTIQLQLHCSHMRAVKTTVTLSMSSFQHNWVLLSTILV